MTLEVIRTPLARQDLLEIWTYIADDSAAAADRMLDRFDAALRAIADHPAMGRARPELGAGLRSFPVGSYVLFYRPSATAIDLVRVLNSFRDIDAAALNL